MTRLQPFQVSREQVVQFGKPAKAVPTLQIGMQAIRLEQERLHSLTVEPPQNKKKQNYEMSR